MAKKKNTGKKYKSVKALLKDLESKKNIFWHISSYYLRVVDFIGMIPKQIKWFIQRGKRGWADCDTWCLGSYLSKITSQGIEHLIGDLHGFPSEKNMTIGKWIDILYKINDTFVNQQAICDCELYYIPSSKSNEEYEELRKEYEAVQKRCQDESSRIMTRKEVKEYEEGWKLFKKYFNDLWD